MQQYALLVVVFLIGGGLGALGMNEYDAGKVAALSQTASACQTTTAQQAAAIAKMKAFNVKAPRMAPAKTFNGGY